MGEKYDSDYIKKVVQLLEAREQRMKQDLSQCVKSHKIKCK